MKNKFQKGFLSVLFIIPIFVFAQNLELNHMYAHLGNEASYGHLFVNKEDQFTRYYIKYLPNINTSYSHSFWVRGKVGDSAYAVRGDYLRNEEHDSTYQSEWYPGPIANDYSSNEYQNRYHEKIWKVTRENIEDHKMNYNSPGYLIHQSILEWPGNGDLLNGEAAQLAPYVDINNNGIYEPELGDYPCIRGDEAVYIILNDENAKHDYDCTQMKVELHLMVYQFFTDNEDVNYTTFIHSKVYNRSERTYDNFLFGHFMDWDIGSHSDDFIGTDTLRQLSYFYNSVYDSSFFEKQVSQGLVNLNGDIKTTMFRTRSGLVSNDPWCDSTETIMMNATFVNGEHLIVGGWGSEISNTPPYVETNYSFTGYRENGWVVPDSIDFRTIQTSQNETQLQPNYFVQFDHAIVTSIIDQTGDKWNSVDSLFQSTDNVQLFYNTMDKTCENSTANIDMNDEFEFIIYPNPSQTQFAIGIDKPCKVQLIDARGSILYHKDTYVGGTPIQVSHLSNGVYFLSVKQDNLISTKKIVVKH